MKIWKIITWILAFGLMFGLVIEGVLATTITPIASGSSWNASFATTDTQYFNWSNPVNENYSSSATPSYYVTAASGTPSPQPYCSNSCVGNCKASCSAGPAGTNGKPTDATGIEFQSGYSTNGCGSGSGWSGSAGCSVSCTYYYASVSCQVYGFRWTDTFVNWFSTNTSRIFRKDFFMNGTSNDMHLKVSVEDGVECYLDNIKVLDNLTNIQTRTNWNYDIDVTSTLNSVQSSRFGYHTLACKVNRVDGYESYFNSELTGDYTEDMNFLYNQTPNLTYQAILPSTAYKSTPLTCVGKAVVPFNPYGDYNVSLNFSWYKNGIIQPQFSQVIITLNNTNVTSNPIDVYSLHYNDNWTCSIKPFKYMWQENWHNETRNISPQVNSIVSVKVNGTPVFLDFSTSITNATFNLNPNNYLREFTRTCVNDSQGFCYLEVNVTSAGVGVFTLKDVNFTLRSFPTNISISIANNLSAHNYTPELNTTYYQDLNISNIMSFLGSCQPDINGFCYLPIGINSSNGNISMRNLLFIYNTTNANNVSLFIGNQQIFLYPRELNTSQVLDVNLRPDLLNQYISNCTTDQCYIPINFRSIAGSQYIYTNMTINYTIPQTLYVRNLVEVNRQIINCTVPNGCNVTFTLNGTNNVNVTFNLNFWINKVLFSVNPANATNRTATIFNTIIDMVMPTTPGFFINNSFGFEMIPNGPVQTAVNPYGQKSTTPIITMSMYNADIYSFNTFFKLNESLLCVGMKEGLTNNYSQSTFMNYSSWTNIRNNSNYNSTLQVWMWGDYNCSYATWRLLTPKIDIKHCCVDCVCGVE